MKGESRGQVRERERDGVGEEVDGGGGGGGGEERDSGKKRD